MSEKQTYRVQGFSCANCAGKFERNVKTLSGVTDVKVNFGASKIAVYGETTVNRLEEAGSFEQLKVTPEDDVTRTSEALQIEKVPFYQKYQSLLAGMVFLIIGIVSFFYSGETHSVTILLLMVIISVSGLDLLKIDFKNLLRFDFDMKALMTLAVIAGGIIGE